MHLTARVQVIFPMFNVKCQQTERTVVVKKEKGAEQAALDFGEENVACGSSVSRKSFLSFFLSFPTRLFTAISINSHSSNAFVVVFTFNNFFQHFLVAVAWFFFQAIATTKS